MLLGFFGCNTKTMKPKTPNSNTKRVPKDSADFNDQDIIFLPSGFKTDSITHFDSSLNLSINIVYAYLKDKSQIALQRIIQGLVNAKMKSFKDELKANFSKSDPNLSAPNDFEAYPDLYYDGNKITSIRYIISIYYSGAVHPLSEYISVNYDKLTKRTFSIMDYLDIKTPADTAVIINKLEDEYSTLSSNSSEKNLWNFYNINKVDFTILPDSISFNYSGYALGQGPGLIYVKFGQNELNTMIRSKYR